MVGFYNYSVILTYLGAGCAVTGICFCVADNPFAAVICLMLSGVCDLFDGSIARTCRRSDREKQFGIQIDSLSDLVCFGALPAAIGFSLGLSRWYEILPLALYVLAALIRLAYYNVTEEEITLECRQRVYYEGMPVTSAALFIPFLFVFRPLMVQAFPHLYMLWLLLLAAAFLMKVRIRKIGMRGMIAAACLGALILAGLLIGQSRM